MGAAAGVAPAGAVPGLVKPRALGDFFICVAGPAGAAGLGVPKTGSGIAVGGIGKLVAAGSAGVPSGKRLAVGYQYPAAGGVDGFFPLAAFVLGFINLAGFGGANTAGAVFGVCQGVRAGGDGLGLEGFHAAFIPPGRRHFINPFGISFQVNGAVSLDINIYTGRIIFFDLDAPAVICPQNILRRLAELSSAEGAV